MRSDAVTVGEGYEVISWAGPIILAFVAGVGLGAFYFGSLLFTVSRLTEFSRPGLVLMAGGVLRTAVVLAGIYVVGFRLTAESRWQVLLVVVCLGGFVLARTLLVRRYGPGNDGGPPGSRRSGETDDAEA